MHMTSWRHLLFSLLLVALVPSVGAATADMSFTDLEGKRVELSSYKGKWVVVNYWATWCPPCLEEIPDLIHFHDSNKDDNAVVVGVNMEELEADHLRDFVDEYMISYPVIPYREDMPLLGNIPGLPTTYLINPQGEVMARKVGPISGDELESFIYKNKQ